MRVIAPAPHPADEIYQAKKAAPVSNRETPPSQTEGEDNGNRSREG